MNKNFQSAKLLIEKSKNILLTMHERMDGDDGGALLAIDIALKALNKQTIKVIKFGVPAQLQFLPGSQNILEDLPKDNQYDLLIMFGCSNKQRSGLEKIIKMQIPILNIDHHPDNTHFGDVNIVEPSKSSVAELVYDFFLYNSWPINKEVATCLLTGMITDTGSFMHANTQPQTLEAAAALMRKGALVDKIIMHTYKNKNPKVLKAWAKALENSYFDEKQKIIYSVMTEEDLKNVGDVPISAFEGFVETLNTIPEAKFAMFLKQDGNVIKGSLRSDSFKNVDVSKIAKIFGGGGHKLASGFSIVGKLSKGPNGKWKVV